jgi:hypothetical protein
MYQRRGDQVVANNFEGTFIQNRPIRCHLIGLTVPLLFLQTTNFETAFTVISQRRRPPNPFLLDKHVSLTRFPERESRPHLRFVIAHRAPQLRHLPLRAGVALLPSLPLVPHLLQLVPERLEGTFPLAQCGLQRIRTAPRLGGSCQALGQGPL